MQDHKVRIGTITANYNNGKYFPECFDALVNQTRRPNFITVIDDASTDNSWEEIIKYAVGKYGDGEPANTTEYKFVRNGILYYFKRLEKNGGPAAARNAGLKFLLDKADVVCVADSDDILYPTKIKKSIDVMIKYPQVGLVYSDYDTLNIHTGQETREYKEPFSLNRLSQECIVSNNSMYSVELAKRVGLYDESLRGPEDYDLWLRLAEVAAAYHIPEALYKYRLTGNNITVTTPSQKFAEQVHRVHMKAEARRNAASR